MTEMAEKLKVQLMQLPSEDRAELAYYLISSLEEAQDQQSDVRAAWEVELERRWQEMESGAAAGKPAEQVLADLHRKYP